jgi:uncharacterized protein
MDLPAVLTRVLEAFPEVRVAWLFGSQLTGKARPDSDLDVAVRWDGRLDAATRDAIARRVIGALTDAAGPLGERTDLVDLDDCDSAVAFRAISEGTLLLARSDADRVRTVAQVARRFDDEAPRRELFRRAAARAAARMGSGGRDGRQ